MESAMNRIDSASLETSLHKVQKEIIGYNKKTLNKLSEKKASTVSPILYFGRSPNHQHA